MRGHDNNPSQRTFSEHLVDYATKNPFLALWNTSLIVGGLFGYLHYSRIGYIPEIDLPAAVTIFIALALTGIFSTMALVFLFQLPAFFLRLILRLDPEPPVGAADESSNSIMGEAMLAYRRSVAALISCTAIIAIGIWCLISWSIGDKTWQSPDVWIGLLGIFLIACAIAILKTSTLFIKPSGNRAEKKNSHPALIWSLKHIDFFLSIALWWLSIGYISIMVNSPILDDKNLSGDGKVLWLTGFLSLVIMVNACVTVFSMKTRHAPLIFFLLAIAPALYFLHDPNSSFSLEKKALSRLGLGSLENSFFLVKPDACDAINVIRENTCIRISPNKDEMGMETKGLGCIRPTFLENRLGTEYLLAYAENAPHKASAKFGKKTEIFIPLKKDDVLHWAFGKTSVAGYSPCSIRY